jgi:predicted phage terminase large subunit-like protein
MQRLHVDDLVGWTKKNEPDQWEYVEVPALDENDKSFWEERYPAEELKRIRDTNMYKFQAQYQQNPIIAGGQMIKSEWFQFYQSHPKYERIFIASDTAMKTGQHNDYSVFMVWGVFQHSIYLIDMLRGKWEAPELLKNIRMLTSQYMLWENRLKASALYIEDKASGVGLVQQLKRESRLPVIPITVTKDKVTRVEEVLPTLEAGRVFLPFDRNYGHNPQIIGECELFARDMSHSHDDIVDTLVHSINVSVGFGRTFSIFET